MQYFDKSRRGIALKICFVAPANSVHTKKWCKWFSQRGHDVYVISLTEDYDIEAKVYFLNSGVKPTDSEIRKLGYLKTIFQVKNIIREIQPDIVNAHYATSYGIITTLAGIDNFILSVWGSDVYDFPRQSIFHRFMLKFILHKAGGLFSTSKAMADECKQYTEKQFMITPFGVDVGLFSPERRARDNKEFVVGTVKTLSPKYGIINILKAVDIIKKMHPEIPIKLRIAGQGAHAEEYHKLAIDLGIGNITTWLGFISQEQAADEWANFDCAIIPSESESESFGVSAVEAEASGCPVIITDIPGLMEATKPGVTSIVVPRSSPEKIAEELVRLYRDSALRKQMGIAGRKFVEENYELNKCFMQVEECFKNYANKVI